MQRKDPKPEISRLEEVAEQVRNGEIKLPRFQRPFVWKRRDMLKLLDSIYRGYPIGSLLIWNSSQKLISERSIEGMPLNESNSEHYPTSYLLDGQQRLTTLCGALYWEGTDERSMWNIHFDLDREEFVYPKNDTQSSLFPLNKLIKTSDFIQQCLKFDSSEHKESYYSIAEKLLKSLKDYKIAVVKLGDMTIEEVAPIFERINSTGRKLTMVDLMMAATWSEHFDLTSAIKSIQECCSELGFDGIEDAYILRSISAAAELGINKDDIQKLRSLKPPQLQNAATDARHGIIEALKFIRDELGIKSFGYIPYGFQFTYLAEYFRLNRETDSNQINHLTQWFWHTSATRYFGTSNTGQVVRDLASIRAYARNRSNSLFTHDLIDITQLLFDRFNFRNATSTTFTLLLGERSPEMTLDGSPLEDTYKFLKNKNFYATLLPGESRYGSMNISRVIHPFNHSLEIRNLNLFSDMDRHLLSRDCINYLTNGDEIGFITSRAVVISSLLSRLTGCEISYMVPEVFDPSDEEFWFSEDP